MEALYLRLARELADSIRRGVHLEGDRLPGIRRFSRAQGVSPATAVAAYRQLEEEGLIEARPRSGFFVRPRRAGVLPDPPTTEPEGRPRSVSGQEQIFQLLQVSREPDIVQFGAAVPDSRFLPTRALQQALTAAARQQRRRISDYEFVPGLPELRRQLARRMTECGCRVDAGDVVITNGCQEALFLCLKLLTRPGDIVALESPTYYGLLQAVDTLGLRALEIPTDPRSGIDLSALEAAAERWSLKVCVVMPNFANPLGSRMPDERKQALVELAQRHDMTLVEDDIYGDLGFSGERPRPLKAFDRQERVIYASSFSKSLAPGLRIGWLASHRLRWALAYQKYLLNSAAPTINQIAVAELLKTGAYERHLNRLRQDLNRSVRRMLALLDLSLPAQVRVTRPEGGFVLWLELPPQVEALELKQAALTEGISIAPGPLFTSTGQYRHHVRLSCAVVWDERSERALIRLADLIKERIRGARDSDQAVS